MSSSDITETLKNAFEIIIVQNIGFAHKSKKLGIEKQIKFIDKLEKHLVESVNCALNKIRSGIIFFHIY